MVEVEKRFFIEFDVGNEGIEEEDVRDSRGETTMEAGVIAPDAGVGIDGENGGDDLRKEKEEEGNIERSSFENEFLLGDTFKDPGSKNNNSNKIHKEHFDKFKNFTSFGPEEKRGEEEKREVAKMKETVEFVCLGHGDSLAFTRMKGRATFKSRWRRK